jgi:hypothetical protein
MRVYVKRRKEGRRKGLTDGFNILLFTEIVKPATENT